MFWSSITTAFAKDHFNVAMITWRGKTKAEQGFIDSLNKSRYRYIVRVQHYDAGQDLTRLNRFLTKLEKKPVDLIYTFGTTSTQITLARIKTTPVVFNCVNRPIEAGIIERESSRRSRDTSTMGVVAAEL